MKNYSVRKIVLSSIGFVASVMLLIGLGFTVIKFDPGFGNELNTAVNQLVNMKASGFDMLSFALPLGLKSIIYGEFTAVNYTADYSIFEKLCGIMSVLSLVAALLGIALTIVSFFCFSKKKSKGVATLFVILASVLTFVYAILSIVFVFVVKSDLKEVYGKVISNSSVTTVTNDAELQAILSGFKTNMFVPLILQLIFTTAYFVCAKTITEKSAENVLVDVGANEAETVRCETAKKKCKEDLFGLIEAESRVIELLTEYKKLCDEAVISSSDYIDKKINLLRYSGRKLRGEIPAIVNKSSYVDVVQAEEAVTAALRGYKKLLDSGIIAEGDFADKKAALLCCVVRG